MSLLGEVRLAVQDQYAAAQPAKVTVQPDDQFAILEATIVDVGTNSEVRTVSAGDADKSRSVSLGVFSPGSYRVTVHGGGARSVTDVFVVI